LALKKLHIGKIAGVHREEVIMSNPSPPYYFQTTGLTYHWEADCSKNNYPEKGWDKANTRPMGRKPCEECKEK
jgi:hypothetical protein